MTGFEHSIEAWLAGDQRRNRKQRHTAKRVFDRLVDEHGFTGTYSPVQRFVKKWTARNRTAGEGFTELVWPAGTAQVDFGQAEAIIAGIRQVLHLLVVTFPFSNMRFVQAYRGETAECVCHGLRRVLEHIGAAPGHLVFDNATGIGRRVGTRAVETKLFGAFKLHYRSESRYCNPYSGHEKGNVENVSGSCAATSWSPNRRPPPWPASTRFYWRGAMPWPPPRITARAWRMGDWWYREGAPAGW